MHAFRSRDEPAVVEKELLSFTSAGVCEAWTGTTISRTKGFLPQGSITALIIAEDGKILDLERCLVSDPHLQLYEDARGRWKLETEPSNKREEEDFKFIVNASPNFTLSLRKPSRWRHEATFVALVGVVVQGLAWALVRYFVGLETQDKKDGLTCYFLGGALTSLGLFVSGYITDAATVEGLWRYCHEFAPEEAGKAPVALVWLQRGCKVEGQDFPPYAIWKPSQTGDDNMAIHVSLRDENAMKNWW